jgi:hypothetical protein
VIICQLIVRLFVTVQSNKICTVQRIKINYLPFLFETMADIAATWTQTKSCILTQRRVASPYSHGEATDLLNWHFVSFSQSAAIIWVQDQSIIITSFSTSASFWIQTVIQKETSIILDAILRVMGTETLHMSTCLIVNFYRESASWIWCAVFSPSH